MPKIIFLKDGKKFEVMATNGDTLLDVTKKNNIPLFGGCDGAGVCGSCHVKLEKKYLEKLEEASDDEKDILDVVATGSEDERLACQVTVSDDLDGMEVKIP